MILAIDLEASSNALRKVSASLTWINTSTSADQRCFRPAASPLPPLLQHRLLFSVWPAQAGTDGSAKTIVDIAKAAGQFSTLLQAAEAAGLVETLSGDGPFTIFAPTDGAFAQLPEGKRDELLQP